MNTIKRLLGFLKAFTSEVLLSVLLGIAATASGIGLLGTSAYLIASAALHPSVADLQVAIVGVRFFGISRAAFRYLERLVSHSVNFRLLAQLRVWFYRALEPLAPARLSQYRSGDLLARAVGDIATLENFYVRVLSPAIVVLVVTLGVSLFVGRYDPLLGLILALGMVFAGIAVPALALRMTRYPGQEVVKQRSQISEQTVENLQGLADLLIYGQQERVKFDLASASQQMSAAEVALAGRGGLANSLGLLSALLTLWVMLWFAIPFVTNGVIDGVSLMVITLITLASFEAVTPLSQAASQFEQSMQSARRLFELVDTEPAVREPAQPAPSPEKLDLEIQHLSFRYQPELPLALNDLSLLLPIGKKVAVVGPSGAGKSTLINILVRFWDYSGSICLDGRELRDYAGQDVRKQMTVLSQSPYIFSATVRQNLEIAYPGAGEDEIERALCKAELWDWVQGLPNGLNTWVGEHGTQMSGGERQRLAGARAILKNSPIVLMDEPTAHLDIDTEASLLKTFRSEFADRSVLLVTHRLVDMEWMDEILVLDGGRVVERGNHSQLLSQGGLYANLWSHQNRLFEE